MKHFDSRDQAILRALAETTEKEGRAVKVSEVHGALRGEYRSMDAGTVRLRLQAATMLGLKGGELIDGEPPAVERHDRKNSTGQSRIFWRTGGSDAEIPVFVDQREAVRHAVKIAVDEAGKPLRKAEIKWWAQANQESPDRVIRAAAEGFMEGAVQSILHYLAFHDERFDRDLRPRKTQQTHLGRHSRRYSASKVSKAAECSCQLEDLATLLRPADELAGIEFLRRLTRETCSSIGQEITEVRSRLLVRSFLALGVDEEVLAGAREMILSATPKMEAWIDAARLSGARRSKALGGLRWTAQQMEVLPDVLSLPVSREPTVILSIGDTKGVRQPDLEEICREVQELLGVKGKVWQNLVVDARRIRAPMGGYLSAKTKDEMYSWLDRPDAFTMLVNSLPMPRIGGLVQAAENVMGFVLRDPAALRSWLDRVNDARGTVRTGLVIALALLGEVLPEETVVRRRSDVDDVQVYIASVMLGEDDPGRRLALVQSAFQHATGEAATVAATALSRVQAGLRLPVVEN